MNRTRDPGICPTCHREPRLEQGHYVCGCEGVYWSFKGGVAGSPDEQELLRQQGWQLVEVSRLIKLPNDFYWVGPYGNILLLHDDDTWYCETAPHRFHRLEEYLAWYTGKTEEIPAAGKFGLPGSGLIWRLMYYTGLLQVSLLSLRQRR